MGYKSGDGLGKSNSGRVDQIPIAVKTNWDYWKGLGKGIFFFIKNTYFLKILDYKIVMISFHTPLKLLNTFAVNLV